MPAPMVTPPVGASLQRLAEQSWDRLGARSVLHFEGSQWTGEQLAERIRRVAGGLQEAGLEPGERVVVCMSNCPEVSITYSAVWRIGAVTTPVLFLLSEDELRHVLSDSEAALIVTTPEFLPKVTAAAADLRSLRGIIVVGGPWPSSAHPRPPGRRCCRSPSWSRPRPRGWSTLTRPGWRPCSTPGAPPGAPRA